MFSFTAFDGLKDPLSQYTIHFTALFIPYRCPKCFESVTLVQPLDKGGAFKGPINGCGSKAETLT